jgi:hypothetical protein
MKFKLWFHAVIRHAHEALMGIVAVMDSPHFIVYALLIVAALCLCLAIAIIFSETGV